MPCLRGIEVSVVKGRDPGDPKAPAGSDNPRFTPLPEFPHSDSSWINLTSSTQPGGQPPAKGNEAPSCQKTQARVSVHIPAEQGLRFAFKWSIKRYDEQSSFIYFVVLFNGRRIVSWGTDPKEFSTGLTEYALYQASSEQDFAEQGVMVKQVGIEKRYFYFYSGPDDRAANHGGHIEVQVFRARDRKLHEYAPAGYREQENWGIICPSGGMTENPKSLTYYDWHLLDHVKSPFATFRFHYRSWDSLRELSIIPPNYPFTSHPNFAARELNFGPNSNDGALTRTECSSDLKWPMATALERAKQENGEQEFHRQVSSNPLQRAPELVPAHLSDHHQLPQPRKLGRDERSESHFERPLPLLPSSLSRSSSVDSPRSLAADSCSSTRAPSVAPSLMSYVDEEFNDLENAEVLTASLVKVKQYLGAKIVDVACEKDIIQLATTDHARDMAASDNQHTNPSALERPLPNPPRSSSSSDYNTSPPASNSSQVSLLHSSGVGSTTRGHFAHHPISRTTRHRAISDAVTQVVHVMIPEAQWMRPGQRTPSPLRRRQTRTGLNALLINDGEALKARTT